MSVSEPRLPWWTAGQSTAFGKKLRSRSPMDRAIDSTPPTREVFAALTIASTCSG